MEQKDSSDIKDNPNIEWNKKKPLPKERKSRRIADLSADNKPSFAVGSAIRSEENNELLAFSTAQNADNLVDENDDKILHFQNMAMRQVGDDEIVINPQEEEEKDKQKRQEFIKKGISLEKSANKLSIIQTSNLIAKETGLKPIKAKTAADTFNSASDNPQELLVKAVNKDVVPQAKLKPRPLNKLKPHQMKDFFAGVKRIEAIGGTKTALNGLKIEDVLESGKKHTKDKHIAKLILQKSGRKTIRKKRLPLKSSRSAQEEFNKLATDKTALNALSK